MEREEHTQIGKAESSNETATLTYKMKASTGYECTGEQHGISPEHWGRICAAIANTAPPAQVPVNQRLLDVAQAILAEDMIPLLPPEYVKRVQLVISDAKNQPACVSDDYVAGIEAVAQMIDKKADDYAAEHGHDDMGSLSFGGGPRGEFRHDHYCGLIELAEEIRALAAAPQPTQQSAQVPDGLQPAIRRAIQALRSRMCSECGDEECCMPHVRQARDELIAMLSVPNPKGGEE